MKCRICETCSQKQHKTVELSLFQSLIHRLKGHKIAKVKLKVLENPLPELKPPAPSKPLTPQTRRYIKTRKPKISPKFFKPRTAHEKRLWKPNAKPEED